VGGCGCGGEEVLLLKKAMVSDAKVVAPGAPLLDCEGYENAEELLGLLESEGLCPLPLFAVYGVMNNEPWDPFLGMAVKNPLNAPWFGKTSYAIPAGRIRLAHGLTHSPSLAGWT
jgi:hypothetical protein